MLYGHHRIDNGCADIFAYLSDVLPMRTSGNGESVEFLFCIKGNIFSVLLFSINGLFIIHIRNSLEEQDRDDVGLVVILIDGAAQNIAGLIEVIEQLISRGFYRNTLYGSGKLFLIHFLGFTSFV